jgi:hypothetical protein
MLHDEADVHEAVEAVREHMAAQGTPHRFGHHVKVPSEGSHIFLYADTEHAARETGLAVRKVLDRCHLSADYYLYRWHPLEQAWEDARVPMPETSELLRDQEYQQRIDDETEEFRASGRIGWEVHAQLQSHHEAVKLAKRFQDEGRRVNRVGKVLVVGAVNEDEASDLALAIVREAPASTSIHDVRGVTVRPPMPGSPPVPPA